MKKFNWVLVLAILFGLVFWAGVIKSFADDKVMVQIVFKAQTAHGEYCDALYFAPEEYEALSYEQIEALKQERVDNWINTIENPPPQPPEPSIEQLQEQKTALEQQLEALKAQIIEQEGQVKVIPTEKRIMAIDQNYSLEK